MTIPEEGLDPRYPFGRVEKDGDALIEARSWRRVRPVDFAFAGLIFGGHTNHPLSLHRMLNFLLFVNHGYENASMPSIRYDHPLADKLSYNELDVIRSRTQKIKQAPARGG